MDPLQQALDLQPEAAARLLVLATLDEAVLAGKRLPDAADLEALHDFRVALRRCRSLIKAHKALLKGSVPKKRREALQELAASTGSARDAEVQLAWLGPQKANLPEAHHPAWLWLTQRLDARRQAAYSGVRGELVAGFSKLEPKLRKGLSRYVTRVAGSALREVYATAAAELIEEAEAELRRALEAVASPTEVDQAHQARIRAKRLRYLLEPLRKTGLGDEAGALVKAMKGLQELLGELHDAHVMAAELATAMVERATERARQQHEKLYASAPIEDVEPSGRDLRAGLLAIDRLVRDRVAGLFEDLVQWRGAKFERFQKQVAAFGEALREHAHRGVEIERKYLLKALPKMAGQVEKQEIDQGWIPGSQIRERLRKVETRWGTRYFRTIKVGTGIARTELEDEAPEEVFSKLWPLTVGHRVRKRRYKVPVGEHVWEIDEFLDRELFLAEVELSDVDEQAELPEWLAPEVVREVTGEPEYVNANLAR